MEPVTLGLSITGVAGLAVSLAYYILRKGAKSKCVMAGKTVTLDVHDTVAADMSPTKTDPNSDKESKE
jgi:hypothetical protein